jgi:hypothetical protein
VDKSQIAIFISLGSLLISALGFVFAIRQSKINRKLEKIRAYDKVYHDASDLLLYDYKKQLGKLFESEDKYLEKAVNEYASAHWLEQTYGMDFDYPPEAITDREKADFNTKVSVAYRENESKKQGEHFDAFINYQSPVFHLKNNEFDKRFKRLMEHVTENLSYFSPQIHKSWEKMRLLTPESVKNEYIALKRINEYSCEAIEEVIEDPYLQILLSIRHEYRQLNRTANDRFSDFWFELSYLPSRLKSKLKRKFNRNEFDI